MNLTRRELLVLSLGAATLGCSADGPTRPTATQTAANVLSSPPGGLPPASRYSPLKSEGLPRLKATAAAFMEVLGTTGAGRTPDDAAMQAVAAAGARSLNAEQVRAVGDALFEEKVQSAEVVYPQLAGLVPLGPQAVEAAVMVIVRQRLLTPAGRVAERVRTCDVRLALVKGDWRVIELASIGGEPVDRPDDLPPPAQRLLDDPRVELPDSARWDIHARRVNPDLLDLLSRTTRGVPIAVTVLKSGHPVNVFGTERKSHHNTGLAIDLWRIGGRAVVAQQASRAGPARRLQVALYRDPALSQVGSPPGTDLDGPRRRSFNDLVHEDHLHVAV